MIDLNSFWFWMISLVVTILWAVGLKTLSQKKNKKIQFFVLLFLPQLIVTLYYLVSLLTAISVYPLWMVFVVLSIIILYSGFWSYTLYEVGGEDKLVWFYLILFINPLWILYRVTEIR